MTSEISFEQSDETFEGWEVDADHGDYIRQVGPIWYRPCENGWEYAFRATKAHLNRAGQAHGGMLATFADYAMGHAVWRLTDKKAIVTVHLGMNYISSATENAVIRCRPEPVRLARSVCFIRADLVADDRKIATADGIWKILGS